MGIDITEILLKMTLLGTQWVLWLLVGLSVLSLSVMLERFIYFLKTKIDFEIFCHNIKEFLKESKTNEAIGFCKNNESFEAKIALVGLENFDKNPNAISNLMESWIAQEKHKLDKGLIILGTLGNNAPFIGLFGTVLGIIQAFHDLATNPDGGPTVVMRGISEALVTTAVGLLVAIPAVVVFNAFNKMVKKHLSNSQSIIKLILAYKEV